MTRRLLRSRLPARRHAPQVDIAFRPPPDFRATSSTFRLLFGEASDRLPAPPPDADELIGLAWVYALHVRSSLERGRVWQAEWMLSHMRENVLALARIPESIRSSFCLSLPFPRHEIE